MLELASDSGKLVVKARSVVAVEDDSTDAGACYLHLDSGTAFRVHTTRDEVVALMAREELRIRGGLRDAETP